MTGEQVRTTSPVDVSLSSRNSNSPGASIQIERAADARRDRLENFCCRPLAPSCYDLRVQTGKQVMKRKGPADVQQAVGDKNEYRTGFERSGRSQSRS